MSVPALDGAWRTSTRTGQNGSCVEVRLHSDAIEVRDTKDRGGPVLRFAAGGWDALVRGIQSGEFDL